jgi:thiol:disulfide interchange protein DsbD
MIPITVTSFLTTADDRSRGLRQAALYAAGIIGSFTGLGLITAALFGASGLARFSANPLVNLAIAALFTFFALSLIGVIRLSLPSSLVARLSSLRPGSSVAMGVVFTLTAFTCTAPFVGSLLVMSSQGNWRWPLAGMLVFSTVFAAPFFLLALVPGLLKRRPRSGDWMPAVELIVGAVEIGAAIKFISNADLVLGWGIFTRQVVVSIWIVILLALIAALLARYSRVRLGLAAMTLAFVALLVPGLFGRRLGELDAFLPPGGGRTASGELAWLLDDYRGAIRQAAMEQRPVLIDFTGYTCTNCRWMEANMFPRDDVKRALDRFVRVRLYTDGLGEPYESQQRLEQRLFGTVALPLYAVIDPTGRPRARFLGMTRDTREFVDFLERSSR